MYLAGCSLSYRVKTLRSLPSSGDAGTAQAHKGRGGYTRSELAGAMSEALADTDPEHAIHLKKLRQRIAFRWSNASIISAFQQWANTVSAEKRNNVRRGWCEEWARSG
jgi:hypothetical protein